jgi:hypothetical protein
MQQFYQPNATIFQFIILTFIYSSTNFGRFPAHHQELNVCSGRLWFYLRIVSYRIVSYRIVSYRIVSSFSSATCNLMSVRYCYAINTRTFVQDCS